MSADHILSRAAMFGLLVLLGIPVLYPYGSIIEGQLLPVTSRAEVVEVETAKSGIEIYVRFEKRRQCEFVGVHWYLENLRLPLQFFDQPDASPTSRPVGDQYTGPWFVGGISSVNGTRAYAVHKCHPLWNTVTEFYP